MYKLDINSKVQVLKLKCPTITKVAPDGGRSAKASSP